MFGLPFDRVCFWLERMWRYKNITKNLDDYVVRRFGELVEVKSLDKKKLYDLIVGRDFVRLEFVVALSKIEEFYREVATLNYYFEGALTPLLWKLSECGKNGDCRKGNVGVVRGLYHILSTGKGMIVAVDFVVKGEGWEKRYNDVHPLNFPFKGTLSLDRFRPQKEDEPLIEKIISFVKRFAGRT